MTLYCQVNATDYDGEIVVEVVNEAGRSVSPYVPAWDDWSRGGLAGPFSTETEARAALEAEADMRDGVGVYFAETRDCPHLD